ncbi:hypothetical protein K3G39_12665 [Pontibacter sp. HSC-14F20]|uniref:hypothetical protein n=1 Tax=Pontibacter sp. HSC-14F20 TaxID=2864136 RepID=UPI001C734AD2|nr:hypothetical protein [Pontibacter sp. HSC-14F20]MBX0334091.1 hypothetical protein [Pontibacter sp. HSC-14F20]
MKNNPNASNAPKGKGENPEHEERETYYLFRDEAGRLHFSEHVPEAGMFSSAATTKASLGTECRQ